jgi:hypothetical protein
MASFTIVTLSCQAQSDASFTISGVFWLNAPANAIVPAPLIRSAVPGIATADLLALRAGTIVEQGFTASTAFGAFEYIQF